MSAFLSVFVFTAAVCAQTGFPDPVKRVVPVYPAAAKAVRAAGIVGLQVEVNSTGKVVSSTPIGGHPLLRRAAEDAGQNWSFNSRPGHHFISLTFVFTPGKVGGKDRVVIHGPYKLELIAGLPIIIDTPTSR